VKQLNKEVLNFSLDGLDLRLQFRAFITSDRCRNHSTGHTTSSAQSLLGRDKDVGDILVFAKKGQVQENLKRLGIGSHDNEFRSSSVESLGGFVGSLFELLVVRSLLDQVKNLVGQVGIGKRECFGVGLGGLMNKIIRKIDDGDELETLIGCIPLDFRWGCQCKNPLEKKKHKI
jgi:hypothetical protein